MIVDDAGVQDNRPSSPRSSGVKQLLKKADYNCYVRETYVPLKVDVSLCRQMKIPNRFGDIGGPFRYIPRNHGVIAV